MIALARERSLQGFVGCLRSLAGRPEEVLAVCGLQNVDVSDSDDWVPFEKILLAYEKAAAQIGDPAFGIKLARYRDFDYLGPIALVARSAPSIRSGLEDVMRYISVQNTGYRIRLVEDAKRATLVFEMSPRLRALADQWIEESLLTSILFWNSFAKEAPRPEPVMMSHTPRSSPEVYRLHFNCEVRFGQPHDGLVFPVEWLDGPMSTPDSQIHQFLEHYLETSSVFDRQLLGTVMGLLEKLIPLNQGKLEVVAAHLHMHPRTLQRQLKAEGLSFREALDRQRRTMAERLIAQDGLPLVNVAYYLGYNDQSAFNHAFERWHGISPSRWRANQLLS